VPVAAILAWDLPGIGSSEINRMRMRTEQIFFMKAFFMRRENTNNFPAKRANES
jgi:hypothetical protein